MSFGANYTHGPFSTAAVYSNEHDQAMSISTMGFTTFQGMPATTYTAGKVENMGAGLSYQFGNLLVHGLYTRVKLQTNGFSDTYQSYDAGANYQFTPFNTVPSPHGQSQLATRAHPRYFTVNV
ncbi:porin [Trinickia violacea]|uniref:Porin n=1 Tax=Trinickia violacea TaxID=2571746 RepID=A0A4V1EGZ9_9BURK|nr:porin [Trinickia violacea]